MLLRESKFRGAMTYDGVLEEAKGCIGADPNGYRYPSTATAALLKLTSIRVARHATSFHGCFAASQWEIGEYLTKF